MMTRVSMPSAAMVFAAGLGSRMRPITEHRPKPLVPIAGKTMLDHLLDRLADAGVDRAVVNVHHLADQIEARLAGREHPRIIVSDERARLLDQGGGIRRALPLLGTDPFLICNTDAVWLEGPTSNLRRLAARWQPDEMDILLLVAAATGSVGVDWQGDFDMDGQGRLKRRRDGTVAAFVYAGIGIVKPELFAAVEEDVFRLAPFFFAAAERGRLFGSRLEGLWLHVGTPEAVAEAEAAIELAFR